MKNSVNLIKKIFKENNYILSDEDIKNLIVQLERKPPNLYKLGIEVLNNKKIIVNYKNLVKLIKLDIRIRDNLKKIISPLEESIRTTYICYKNISINENKEFFKNNEKNFSSIIEEIFGGHINKKLLEDIRDIRNLVSHLTYPIIYNKIDDILSKLERIKKIEFVDEKTIEIYIEKINNNINCFFDDESLKTK